MRLTFPTAESWLNTDAARVTGFESWAEFDLCGTSGEGGEAYDMASIKVSEVASAPGAVPVRAERISVAW